ncbi:MAG: ABC transporter ATP-binding protein [Lachnospiraceae bacterium]|nr:ABC transporter ATP-binding protein [Lachnospiraceae bacterium]
MEKIIEVKDLNKTYYLFDKEYKVIPWLLTGKGCKSQKEALKNISFQVTPGEIVGIIGVNGAGKSTLMKLIAGITYPTSGEVNVHGRIGSLINLSAGFHPDYSGRKNIYYKGTMMGLSQEQIDNIIEDVEAFVELGEYFDRPIRMYSAGMAARLGFALAVFMEPEILIVDEVLAVGDKKFQQKSREKILEMFQNGKAVLFSSHSDQLIEEFCNRVLYLKDGCIVFDGEVKEGLCRYNEDLRLQKK